MTKRYLVTSGYCGSAFDVSVADDTDLSQKIECVCNDTGAKIYINGWLADWEQLEMEDDSE
tara:strand:- start:343 stop:525 length:183 start_codon:yes stop_codon:yes gene_type:complete